MKFDIHTLIGEATAYDKKQQIEAKRPKSWLKSVSAFANGEGGTLIFGISDDGQVVGLENAELDSELISEAIKTKLEPIPSIKLEFQEFDGRKLILLYVAPGDETPYYYIGDKQRVAFVRNNSHKKWWKEATYREELPDYPERAVTEVISNAIIHRNYLELGSEIHIDMYDNRMEVYSPGGMIDGRLIQHLDPMNVPSKRRNPLLADFFNRLELMERRGSGMKKIVNEYRHFEKYMGYKEPEFKSNSGEFHVILWNLNYISNANKEFANSEKQFANETKEFANSEKQFANDIKEFANSEKQFANDIKETAKVVKQRKEFVKAKRAIYKLISSNPKTTTVQMAEKLNVSTRQVQKYLKRLTDQNLIVKEGNRINGSWKILDEEYTGFFGRI